MSRESCQLIQQVVEERHWILAGMSEGRLDASTDRVRQCELPDALVCWSDGVQQPGEMFVDGRLGIERAGEDPRGELASLVAEGVWLAKVQDLGRFDPQGACDLIAEQSNAVNDDVRLEDVASQVRRQARLATTSSQLRGENLRSSSWNAWRAPSRSEAAPASSGTPGS